jgi:hypothetical protein
MSRDIYLPHVNVRTLQRHRTRYIFVTCECTYNWCCRETEIGAAALNAVLDRPLPAAAVGLLELVKRELAGRMPEFRPPPSRRCGGG